MNGYYEVNYLADVAAEVAHFSMDLDWHRRKNVQSFFVKGYASKSKAIQLKNYENFCFATRLS
jgi:aminoglycoside phosphotransferase family enzyme